MRTGNHLSASFEVWDGGHAWFWFVTDACGGAAIGAAINEAEAIRDAHWSIEEMQRPLGSAVSPGNVELK
jgi:hypothetical protein